MAAGFDQRVSFTSSDTAASQRFRDRSSRRPATAAAGHQTAPTATRDAMRQVAAAAPAAPATVLASQPTPTPPQPAEPETDGLRACARGDWCEGRTVHYDDDSQPIVQPARTYQAFCQPDIGLIEAALLRMPRQFLWLTAEIGNPARHGRPIHVPFGPKVPIRCDIDALVHWTVDCLTSWHERVAAALDLNPTWHHQRASEQDLAYVGDELSRARRNIVTVRDAVKTLAPRVETLISLPGGAMSRWADDWLGVYELGGAAAGLEILALEYKTRAVLGQTDPRPDTIDGVPCRKCEAMTLEAAQPPSNPAAPVMASMCTKCGDTLSRAELHDWSVEYSRWAQNSGLPACKRCQRDRHNECQWDACPCRFTGHALAA